MQSLLHTVRTMTVESPVVCRIYTVQCASAKSQLCQTLPTALARTGSHVACGLTWLSNMTHFISSNSLVKFDLRRSTVIAQKRAEGIFLLCNRAVGV